MVEHTQALRQVSEEARSLRRTLLQTYAGERLRKVFDWSQSGAGGTGSGDCDDDVSGYLNQLTEMEQRLYYAGSLAVTSLEEWKVFGNRRLLMGPIPAAENQETTQTATASPNPAGSSNYKRTVTPGEEVRELEPKEQRRRLQ